MTRHYSNRIPNESKTQWNGIGTNAYAADFHDASNVDLERVPGRIATALRANINTDSSDVAGTTTPTAFVNTDADGTSKWFSCASIVLKSSSNSPTATFAKDTGYAGTAAYDAVVHESNNGNQRLIVTDSTTAYILNSSGHNNAWNTYGFSMSASYKHPMARWDANRTIAVGDGNLVHTADHSDVITASRLIFPPQFFVAGIVTNQDGYWFMLQSTFWIKSAIAYWDGSSTTYNNIYYLDDFPTMMCIQAGVPWILTTNGTLLAFNGNSFSERTHFPFKSTLTQLVLDYTAINPRAMTAVDDLIYMFVAPTTNQQSLILRGGIWVYNTSTGNLYHTLAIGQYKTSGTDIDFGASVVGSIGAIVYTNTSPSFLIGAQVYTNFATPSYLYGIYMAVNLVTVNRSRIRTGYIRATGIYDIFRTLWMKGKNFALNTASIIIKYRTSDALLSATALPIQATLTWTAASTLNGVVPAIVSNSITPQNAHIEILAGDNAGCTFNIQSFSAIPDGSTAINVTLDENAPYTSSRGVLVRFDNWIKMSKNNPITQLGASAAQLPNTLDAGLINSTGAFVQFEIEMRGTDMQLESINVDTEDYLSAPL